MEAPAEASVDQQIKEVQLAAARLDLQLKEHALRNRPTAWKTALTNPIVLGAIITAFVTLNTSIVGLITSGRSANSTRKRRWRCTNSTS
jgi:hypothetical protein